MSHFTLTKIEITNPDLGLLEQTIRKVAKDYGMECVVQRVESFLKADIGGRIKINCLDGKLTVTGETSMTLDASSRIKQEYTALGMQKALGNLGYRTARREVKETVTIKAEVGL